MYCKIFNDFFNRNTLFFLLYNTHNKLLIFLISDVLHAISESFIFCKNQSWGSTSYYNFSKKIVQDIDSNTNLCFMIKRTNSTLSQSSILIWVRKLTISLVNNNNKVNNNLDMLHELLFICRLQKSFWKKKSEHIQLYYSKTSNNEYY